MQVMHSMELDDDDKIDTVMPFPTPSKPDYPYGLKICLTEKEFKKLGLSAADAVVGGVFHMHAMARVTSVSMTDDGGEQCCRVEAQIEDLAIESEDAENKD